MGLYNLLVYVKSKLYSFLTQQPYNNLPQNLSDQSELPDLPVYSDNYSMYAEYDDISNITIRADISRSQTLMRNHALLTNINIEPTAEETA